MNSNEMYDEEIDSNEGQEIHLGFNNQTNKIEEEKASTGRYNTRASRAAQRGLKRGNKLLEKSKNGSSKAE